MSNETKPTCVLIAPVATRSGYGDHARGIAKTLIEWGKFDVKIVPTRWGSTPQTELDRDTPLNNEIKKRLLNGPLPKQPDVQIQVTIPNEFQPQAKFNIGITAGIETTLPRAEWIEGLNRMNLNIVPSKFAKEVFEKTTYTKNHTDGRSETIKMNRPMEVVFEGVDVSTYKKIEGAEEIIPLNEISSDFNFLFVGHWLQGDLGADRKDIGMLIKVFSEVFKGKKNRPGLILKTSGATFSMMDRSDILTKIDKITSAIGSPDELPPIYLIHGDLSPDELNGLYNHPKVKVHVSFTHGEGFGRPLLESTLSGKPLLTTNWSGHLDFLPTPISNLIPGEVKQIHPSASNEWIVKESGWFVASYSTAASKIEDMFKNYQSYLGNAEKLRKENSAKFTQENESKLFIEILEKHLPKFEVQVPFQMPVFKKVTPST